MLKTPVSRLYNDCMKTNIVKLLAFVAAATLALSVNAADKAPISGSVSTGYATENFYRGADLGDDTLKVGAELRGGVAGLNAFGSVVTDQSIDGDTDQYYITAGIASQLFGLDLASGYLHTEGVPGDATGELFARLTADKLFNLSGVVYYELDDELWTTEIGVSETIDLDLVSVTGRATVGNTEVTNSNDRTYYVVGADLRHGLVEDVDLVAGVEYVDADDREDDTLFHAGLQVKF
jgi:hypothetical protein